MNHEKVSRLRQLLSEAVPIAKPQPQKSIEEDDAWRRYQSFVESDPLPALDTSRRARCVRNINRIAISYGWVREIQHFLDKSDAAGIGSLDEDAIERLHDRMVALEDCLQNGCDPPDIPAAR